MKKILIVDDEANIRLLISKALEDAKYEVQAASDGVDAMRKFQGFQPDLVVTDIIMPNKEGVQLITELKSIAPDLKIIAISGGGLIGPTAYLELAKQLGADEVITKPFKMQELVETIYRLLQTE
jgi:CheY-like chemotaxis protein